MGSPISMGDALTLISKALEIYNKITECPKQITDVGIRMKRLKSFLNSLNDLLISQSEYGLAAKRPAQITELREIVVDVEADAKSVHQLLERWDDKVGPWGMQWRWKPIADVWFALGSSPAKLEELTGKIDRHMQDIDHQIVLLNAFGHDEQLKIAAASAKKAAGGQKRAPSRSPRPLRSDYHVIFVDPRNTARSKVAEAYCKLLRELTNASKTNDGSGATAKFRIKWVHSAGLKVLNRSDCADIVKRTLLLDQDPGGQPPARIPMAALFDNSIQYPNKGPTELAIRSSSSRGITKSLFSTYDFIFVFEQTHYVQLLRLRKAFAEELGAQAIPRGKGRVVMLGESDILNPKDSGSEVQRRKEWNKCVATIKLALKAWLTKEMQWQKP
jgi:protein-tyrosine-phosphatase